MDAPSRPTAAISGAPPLLSGVPNALQARRHAVHVWPATADISADSSITLALRHGAPGTTFNDSGLPPTSSCFNVALSMCRPTCKEQSTALYSAVLVLKAPKLVSLLGCLAATADISADSHIRLALRQGTPDTALSDRGLPPSDPVWPSRSAC